MLKTGVNAAIFGIFYHFFRTFLAVFLPQYNNEMIRGGGITVLTLHVLYMVSLICIGLFFLFFSLSFDKRIAFWSRSSAIAVYLTYLLNLILFAGITFIPGAVDTLVQPSSRAVFVLFPFLLVFTQLAFFTSFKLEFVKNEPALNQVGSIGLTGIILLTLAMISGLIRKSFPESLANILEKLSPVLSLIAYCSLLIFFIILNFKLFQVTEK